MLLSRILYPSHYPKNLKAETAPQNYFLFFWLKSKTYTFTALPLHMHILQNTANI